MAPTATTENNWRGNDELEARRFEREARGTGCEVGEAAASWRETRETRSEAKEDGKDQDAGSEKEKSAIKLVARGSLAEMSVALLGLSLHGSALSGEEL
ncbi:uncharacterized protein DS421_10g304580 [Arachis hypogaea]|nr:uncharacterized protein DS421_10g304580 [Arachis hypogaea]